MGLNELINNNYSQFGSNNIDMNNDDPTILLFIISIIVLFFNIVFN